MCERKELKQKAVNGVLWTSIQKFASAFMTLVSEMFLARLLMPYDFGCIEMLAIFMLLAETLVSGGFGSALIQKKQPVPEDYSTVFVWNMGVSIMVYFALWMTAPVIAQFYSIPQLCSILRVQGLILFIHAFNIVQLSQLRKQLRFKEISTASIVASIISLFITIVMAYSGFGVWALVSKNLIFAFIVLIITWIYTKWKPSVFFSWQSFKELFGFGFFMLLSNLVTSISAKIQGLMVGKVYSPVTMGYYSKASGTEGVISSTISQILDQVTYPLYAEIQDDYEMLRFTVKRLTLSLAFVVFPILSIAILVAEPMFALFYSDKWLISVPYFRVLCLGGFATCLQSVNFQTISAIGKSRINFRWTLIKRLIGIGLIIGGLMLWGIKGILLGAVINAWISYFVNICLVSKYIGYKWYRQLLDLLPLSLINMALGVLCYMSVSLMSFDLYLDGIVKLILYAVLFVLWVVLFKPNSYKYLKDMSIPILRNLKFRK